MKFKVTFDAVRYFQGVNAYELSYQKDFDDGGRGSTYWTSGGFFLTEDEAVKAASVVKKLNTTKFFEV